MTKYYAMLDKVLTVGREQRNKKGVIRCLFNEQLSLLPGDLLAGKDGVKFELNV